MAKLIGYARISTAGEGLDLQKEALDQAGVDELFVDVADAVRCPQLKRALMQLRKGHTFVVWRLDRVGRNFRHLIEMVQDLDNRGIGFCSLDDNIDTTTATGKRVSWGALAKFGRDVREEAKARASGCRLGRKPKLDEKKQDQALTLYNQGLPVEEICRRLKISPSTLFRALRKGPKRKRKPGRKPQAKAVERSSANSQPGAAGNLVRLPVIPRAVGNHKRRS